MIHLPILLLLLYRPPATQDTEDAFVVVDQSLRMTVGAGGVSGAGISREATTTLTRTAPVLTDASVLLYLLVFSKEVLLAGWWFL